MNRSSNYLTDQGEAGFRADFGSHYARQALLKARVDPDNLFRLNPRIKPSV
jgi:hypothetical protein